MISGILAVLLLAVVIFTAVRLAKLLRTPSGR
jgi:hypothetical protein